MPRVYTPRDRKKKRFDPFDFSNAPPRRSCHCLLASSAAWAPFRRKALLLRRLRSSGTVIRTLSRPTPPRKKLPQFRRPTVRRSAHAGTAQTCSGLLHCGRCVIYGACSTAGRTLNFGLGKFKLNTCGHRPNRVGSAWEIHRITRIGSHVAVAELVRRRSVGLPRPSRRSTLRGVNQLSGVPSGCL
jgi:hypothetical protein